jgi:hypothetical protein
VACCRLVDRLVADGHRGRRRAWDGGREPVGEGCRDPQRSRYALHRPGAYSPRSRLRPSAIDDVHRR